MSRDARQRKVNILFTLQKVFMHTKKAKSNFKWTLIMNTIFMHTAVNLYLIRYYYRQLKSFLYIVLKEIYIDKLVVVHRRKRNKQNKILKN